MEKELLLKKIAEIHTDFPEKFGIPRQSGLAETKAEIIFEPEYRIPEAVRGLEEYSHLWLIWEFTEAPHKEWSPTVRPPRLGGNQRIGVFATRSPFRPNSLGLSSVRLEKVEMRKGAGPVLHVIGADLLDGTPIYDIKPYLPYVDSHPEAEGGFAEKKKGYALEVMIEDEWMSRIPAEKRQTLIQILSQDPRPSYQNDPERVYGMSYAGMEIRFKVNVDRLTVCEVCENRKKKGK